MDEEPATSRREPHRRRDVLVRLLAEATPVDLRLLGRVLIHAIVVGLAAGAAACVLYYLLERGEDLLLEGVVGYPKLRAGGEHHKQHAGPFYWWLLLLVVPLGAGLSSLVARRAKVDPEGGDAAIDYFHHQRGDNALRVIFLKPIMMVLSQCTGSSGGREGPTMHIGAAVGATVARVMNVTERERRILIVAGLAAALSGLFRAPLGAALLSVEVLYRDDFESEALIPAVLASVIGYSLFIGVHGDATLIKTAPSYPFVIGHLPWYALLGVLLAGVGALFVSALRDMKRRSADWPVWGRAAIGGFGVAALAASVGTFTRGGGGLLGGGYGLAQVALGGADWLGEGANAVVLLLLLCLLKLLTTTFSIGSGATVGAFAPVLAVGALFGGAFGRAVMITVDSSVDPGAFALVAMAALFGGIAHAPLGALVMVCEMASSYDLLVPLMLTGGIAFVALRNRSLYASQPAGKGDSPAHPPRVLDVLSQVKVRQALEERPFVHFSPGTPVTLVMRQVAEVGWQDVFPVLDDRGALCGMITPELLRVLGAERELEPWVLALDCMQPAVTVHLDDDLRVASERMLTHGLRELLVVDDDNRIHGTIDEAEISQTYLDKLG